MRLPKTGRVVILKEGTAGLYFPENVGILLRTFKGKKGSRALLYTIKGEVDAPRSAVRGTLPLPPVDLLSPETDLKDVLKRAVHLNKVGEEDYLSKSPENILIEVKMRDLWRAALKAIEGGEGGEVLQEVPKRYSGLTHPRGFTPRELGELYFSKRLRDEHVEAIKKILSPADDGHYGYFVRLKGERRHLYFPYRNEVMSAAEEERNLLRALANALIPRYEEGVAQEAEGGGFSPTEVIERLRSLKGEKREALERIINWAEHYIENATWGEDFHISPAPIRRMEDFELEDFLLKMLWRLFSGKGMSLVSALTELMLLSGRWGVKDAVDALMKYHTRSGRFHFPLEHTPQERMEADVILKRFRNEEFAERRDLTDLTTYTIDPPDAKDFDDAVSILEGDGKYRIFVHIADVSHYVKPGSDLDTGARLRTTSVYLPNRVLPMFPPEISEVVCSLKGGERRAAFTVEMEVNQEGEVERHWIYPSVIVVDENLSYPEAERRIREGDRTLSTLYSVVERMREAHPRLDLETPEKRVRFGEDGEVEVEIKRPTPSTRMIETLMVKTNEIVAEVLKERMDFGVFRIHPLPVKDDVEEFNKLLEGLGVERRIEVRWEELKGSEEREEGEAVLQELLQSGKITLGGGFAFQMEEKEGGGEGGFYSEINPEDLEIVFEGYRDFLSWLDREKEGAIKDIITEHLLRSLSRAVYYTKCLGHFGLNTLTYTHFTSPIRRYPDVLVHRMLKSVLGIEEYQFDEMEVEEALEQANEMEKEAEEFEYLLSDAALIMDALFNEEIMRGEARGLVVSLTPTAAYLRVGEVLEGRLPYSRLSPGRVSLDESGTRVYPTWYVEGGGETERERFRMEKFGFKRKVEPLLTLGTSVPVRIHHVEIAEGFLDLQLA